MRSTWHISFSLLALALPAGAELLQIDMSIHGMD